MKTFPLAFVLAFLCAVPALAQSSYRFDNFDTANGVRVASVPTTAVLPSAAKSSRRTNKSNASLKVANTRMTAMAYTPAPNAVTAISNSLDGFTTGDANIDALISQSGARNGVDPALLYSMMHQESSFKRGAISPKGARGLMQLMPATAARFGVSNIFDPRQNIEGGARYVSFLLNLFDNDVRLTLAGYNAGEGAVLKYGRNVPPYRETQEYVRRIKERYDLMRDPQTAHNARRLTTTTQVAEAQSEQPVPLSIYERSVSAVRLPDGRLQLVSQ